MLLHGFARSMHVHHVNRLKIRSSYLFIIKYLESQFQKLRLNVPHWILKLEEKEPEKTNSLPEPQCRSILIDVASEKKLSWQIYYVKLGTDTLNAYWI